MGTSGGGTLDGTTSSDRDTDRPETGGEGGGPIQTKWANALIGYWPFDDSTGRDRSALGTDLTVIAGNYGPARVGFGVNRIPNTLIEAPAPRFDLGSAPFTIHFWLRADDAAGRTYLGAGNDEDGWAVGRNGEGKLVFRIGGTSIQVTEAFTPGGSWRQIAVVRDASNTVVLFVDGSKQTATGDVLAPQAVTTSPFAVGRGVATGTETMGTFDEIAIWKRALSAQEIADLYNAGSGTSLLAP